MSSIKHVKKLDPASSSTLSASTILSGFIQPYSIPVQLPMNRHILLKRACRTQALASKFIDSIFSGQVHKGDSEASVKLYVRWDVLGGQLWGPSLTDGKHDDHHSPLSLHDLPAGALYVADLGFLASSDSSRLHGETRTANGLW